MDEQKLIEWVNRSGFPLQVRVRHLVEQTRGSHGWSVRHEEHAWRRKNLDSGFIDLVVENEHQTSVMVVECKRALDVTWVFLVDREQQMNRRHFNGWMTRKAPEPENGKVASREIPNGSFAFEYVVEPTSPEAMFCVVGGKDGHNRQPLESVAVDLCSSVEGLAEEEWRTRLDVRDLLRMYFPVVVTTAPIRVCRFDPVSVGLSDGKMENAVFEEVPFVRFRKQLDPNRGAGQVESPTPRHQDPRRRESSIFVVHGASFADFLRAFEVSDSCLRGI